MARTVSDLMEHTVRSQPGTLQAGGSPCWAMYLRLPLDDDIVIWSWQHLIHTRPMSVRGVILGIASALLGTAAFDNLRTQQQLGPDAQAHCGESLVCNCYLLLLPLLLLLLLLLVSCLWHSCLLPCFGLLFVARSVRCSYCWQETGGILT